MKIFDRVPRQYLDRPLSKAFRLVHHALVYYDFIIVGELLTHLLEQLSHPLKFPQTRSGDTEVL